VLEVTTKFTNNKYTTQQITISPLLDIPISLTPHLTNSQIMTEHIILDKISES